MSQIQGSINKILESSGDILLKVWSDNGEMVPNSSVDTFELNRCVDAYQKQLDELELEIKQWLIRAKNTQPQKQESPIDAPAPEQPAHAPGQQEKAFDDDLGIGDFLGESQMDFMF